MFDHLKVIAALCLAALVVGWFLDLGQERFSGTATVIDGDTIRIGEDTIRLVGFDAPERRQNCRDGHGAAWSCGVAARERLAELVRGEHVDCEVEGEDQYRRTLATCRAGESDLGTVLVSEGLAFSEGAYQVEEEEARRHKRGIWQGRVQRPSEWRREQREVTFFEWVFGLFGR